LEGLKIKVWLKKLIQFFLAPSIVSKANKKASRILENLEVEGDKMGLLEKLEKIERLVEQAETKADEIEKKLKEEEKK